MMAERFAHWPVLLVAALCVACEEPAVSAPPNPLPQPNVLLVVVDSLRADHLGSFGYARETSPFLNEFARRGARFTQAYAHSSHTKLSVASILTGLTPPNHGLRSAELTGEKRSDSLSRSAHTLAESFKAAGYATAAFVTNPHLKPKQGFSQGFDKYVYMNAKETRAQRVNKKALTWLRRSGRPFFLYLHHMDVHFPYDPPSPFQTLYSEERSDLTPLRLLGPGSFDRETIEYSMALYDADINYWDDRFRHLIGQMESAGQMDDTLVIVLSDHGEEFGEHAGFGHGYTAYGEVLHVPLVVVYDGVVPKGIVRDDLVQLIDLAPTISRLAGLDHTLPFTEGRDLFAPAPTHSAEPAVYSETFRGRKPRSLRTSKHHLIYNSDDDTWEFYRLDEDPKGMLDRYGAASPLDATSLAALKARLLEQMGPKEHAVEGESVELDDATIEQLRELGYLQ